MHICRTPLTRETGPELQAWTSSKLKRQPFREGTDIKFDAPAVLRKWPSSKNERVSASPAAGPYAAGPYIVFDGSLDECIREFMSKPASQHHLYEIHTAPQAELITAVLSAEQIVVLARLRDFL